MISEETEKELKELLKEINQITTQLRNYIILNKKVSETLSKQIHARNLDITDKIEKMAEKIEKEQGYDKARN